MSDLNFSLLPWQQIVYSDDTRFKVIAAGRRCGKSRLAASAQMPAGISGAVRLTDDGAVQADHLGLAAGLGARGDPVEPR